jgi:hypothetical protein
MKRSISEEGTTAMAILRIQSVTIRFAGATWGAGSSSRPSQPARGLQNDLVVVESQSGQERAFALYHSPDAPSYGLSAEETSELLRLAAHIQVTAPWQGMAGLDGTIYTLTLEGAMSSAAFQWWVQPPSGWESVGALFDYVRGLAQRIGENSNSQTQSGKGRKG